MLPSSTLLSFLVLALSITTNAKHPLRRGENLVLDLVTKIKGSGSKNIADIDRSRVADLIARAKGGNAREATLAVTNTGVTYTANVGVGSPPTNYTLLIDTGSSNTWLGANKPYVKTKTSKDTHHNVSVSYGSGNFSGEEYTDTVTLKNRLTITEQSIGVANTSNGFGDGIDGILGVGPTDLTVGTVEGTTKVPTVMDNLLSQGRITHPILGIYYEPASLGHARGSLSFGQVERYRTTDSVKYVPLTQTHPASEYWGIDQSMKYGKTPLLAKTAGIVDTGTTLILIATDAFRKYQEVTGGIPDNSTGLLKITPHQYKNLKSLTFTFGSHTYTLNPNAQIFPRSLNHIIGGHANGIYLIVADIGSPKGQGLDFINGYTFLERFYSVYDSTPGKKRVGFAKTKYTDSQSN